MGGREGGRRQIEKRKRGVDAGKEEAVVMGVYKDWDWRVGVGKRGLGLERSGEIGLEGNKGRERMRHI